MDGRSEGEEYLGRGRLECEGEKSCGAEGGVDGRAVAEAGSVEEERGRWGAQLEVKA